MAGNNGHFMRTGGQHNNKRGRGRNRRHGGGGGGGGGSGSGSGNYGGNSGNRVLDSNGPDVKLRGTAQTIAEKYMQLGRDAQLSGDIVMSESYYQHGEHYYRLWLANQPAGQPIQFSRRPNEDDMDEDGAEGDSEGDDEIVASEGQSAEGEPVAEGAEPVASAGDGDGQQNAQHRNFKPREPREGQGQVREGQVREGQAREGQSGRERFRNRWPRRNQESPRDESGANRNAAPDDSEADKGNWETPSFLTRPAPVVPDEPAAAEPAPERRPPRARRERTETPEE